MLTFLTIVNFIFFHIFKENFEKYLILNTLIICLMGIVVLLIYNLFFTLQTYKSKTKAGHTTWDVYKLLSCIGLVFIL